MPIDPNIILQAGKGVTPLLSPLEIQQQRMESELGGYKLQQVRQNMQDDAAYRDILRSNPGAETGNRLLQAGLGKQAGEWSKLQADQTKSKADAEKSMLEGHLKKFEITGQIMSGVTDQATLDGAIQKTSEVFGPEVAAKIPKQYDPQLIAQNQARAMSVKDQLEQRYKMLTAGETQRHNQATESTTIRGQDLTANSSAMGRDVTIRGQDLTDSRAREAQEQKKAPKPMPAAALKMQQEGLDAIGTASSINSDLDAIDGQITSGKLKFGPASNLINRGMNAAGASSEESRNFASFQANMEKLRNDSLRLNKGVQTDGDAQRAWNELFSNINDTKVVQQRLGEIRRLNERAVQLRKLDIDNVRGNYGQEPMDTEKYQKQPTALNGGKSASPDMSAMEAEMKRRGLLK